MSATRSTVEATMVQTPAARDARGVECTDRSFGPIDVSQPRLSGATKDEIFAVRQPYPAHYVSSWKMKNGAQVLLRPIRPEDEPAMARFHETISDRSTYLRFFHVEKLSSRVAHNRLVTRCCIDYDKEMAFVAEHAVEPGEKPQIIAVGRLVRAPETKDAEVAVLVADSFQGLGLGSELLSRLIQFGRDKKLERITAVVLPENIAMRTVAARHGFAVLPSDDLTAIHLVLSL